MNKSLIITISSLMLASWSCQQKTGRTDLVTTIHPFAQIIQPLLGENLKVKALMPPNASPHTFRLKPSQIELVEQTGILITGHEHLDRWAYGLPSQQKLELLSLIPENYLLYFDENEAQVDPHFWTDPLTVKALLPALTRKLSEFLPEHQSELELNMNRFSAELDNLHLQLKAQLASLNQTAVILSHPFFRYYLNRYGFKIEHIIESHAGNIPTPRSVQNIIELLPQKNVQLILTHPNHSDNIAQIIGQSGKIPLCRLDPLGGTTGRYSYAEILTYNTNKIIEALH